MATAKKSTQDTTLQDIKDRLDVVISMMLRSMSTYGDTTKGLQTEILKLCDYEHTTADIQRLVKKSASHVNKELSLLRSKGLVKSVSRDGRHVHVRF